MFRLHKAIYGIKRAPRAWFQRFSSLILRFGFTQSRADDSLFVYRASYQILVLSFMWMTLYLLGTRLLCSSLSSLLSWQGILDQGPWSVALLR